MNLKPVFVAEYKRRHDEIWSNLERELRAAGICNYSIFLDKATLTIFAAQKQTDKKSVVDLSAHPIVKKWWAYMAPVMEVNADNSPARGNLNEVFQMD
jgi:L-rhamnose mutarotase